ncbi:hypothetical protein SAMN04488023_10973 [Pedobacter rhizosphaerae]|uniref:Uncharacterized protein n=1 Tax=Pedobacter rhizosphaerae TaxID=390241 RepID=A0A1H9P8F0_9SPHI|nr:hypothetical protein SAMN04488023_10973 [Pedobacter rhizosphaerae]
MGFQIIGKQSVTSGYTAHSIRTAINEIRHYYCLVRTTLFFIKISVILYTVNKMVGNEGLIDIIISAITS